MVLLVILLFNVLFFLFSAVVISNLSLSGTEKMSFFEAAFCTITMILDAGCIQFVVADMDGVDYDEAFETLPEKIALVVGNEGNGASQIEEYDQMVRIPLENNVESLNVGVATGVLLYEIRRRRKHQG